MVNFREFLRYESGSLIWIKKPGNRSTVKIGSIAGTRCPQGYVRVRLFGKSYLAHRVVWELMSGLIPSGMQVNREAQPAVSELGEIRVGRLPTMNQEEYPGLGDWWVQLRIGENHDEILARVYGATPEEAMARARALTAPPAPAVPGIEELRLTFERSERESHDGFNLHKYGIGYADEATQARWESWLSCRAAMLAQHVSGGYKFNSPEIPDGWKLVPIDATRAMIDAAKRVEEDGYDAMHKAMLAAAPDVPNGADQ